jgi:FkbM family methyltransferase
MNTSINDGTIAYQCDGEQRVLTFPDTGNARFHYKKIIEGGDYRLINTQNYKPECFVDIGANVGATSIFFAQHFPDTRFLCYEPSPTNFGYLEVNTHHIRNLERFSFGLNDEAGIHKLYSGRRQCLQYSLKADAEVTDSWQAVEIRNAYAELERKVQNSSILKVDTEGCELSILNNLAPMLSRFDVIYLEYHSESDRITIDSMLRENYVLWLADATLVHRGLVSYISRRLFEAEPGIGALEISGTV